MSVAVMGGASHLKRPWDEAQYHPFDNLPVAPTSSVRELNDPFSAESLSPEEQRLLPISLSPELPADAQIRRPSPPLHRGDISRSADTSGSGLNHPLKRPRLLDDPEIELTAVDKSISATSPSNDLAPSVHESNSKDQIQSPSHKGSRSDESSFTPACWNCSDTNDLVRKLVSGLLDLEAEIRHALSQAEKPETATEDSEKEIVKLDLRSTLRDNQPSHVRLTTNRGGECRGTIRLASASAGFPRRTLDAYDKDRPEDNSHPQNSQSSQGWHPPRMFESLSGPTMFPDQSRKGQGSDQTPSHRPHSPHRTGSVSTYASGQSPMQIQNTNRTLPSPSSFQYPPTSSALQGTYSPSMSQSAQSAHLQDLQHQISTKTLALQTLQREHDQLLAAFSRSQIRCSTLDKKSQVSDHEINSLTEEKIRLQAQVDSLEAQVEDLLKAKDELQQQTTAVSAQWRQIVAMSSQLQALNTEETKRYKADREAWERDRDGLQHRISELESGKLTLVDSSRPGDSGISIPREDILSSTSLEELRAEIIRLRGDCAEMEVALQELRRVTEQMDQVMNEFADIRERINVQTRHGLREAVQGQQSTANFRESESPPKSAE